jgi:predicted nucleic acid-binding Zn ribbon protein
MTEPYQMHCEDASAFKESTSIPIDQDPHKLAKRFTLSEGFAMGFWSSIPQKPGNNVCGCRIPVEPPAHLQKKASKECRTSIIADLLAKKTEIKFRAKDLNQGLMMNIGSDLVPNILPTFVLNLLAKPRRMLTYMMSIQRQRVACDL